MLLKSNYFTFPLYIPSIIRLFENWPLYLYNYIGRTRKVAQYKLRNGLQLLDSTGTLAGTIAAIFVREEYGSFSNLSTIVDIGANMGAFTIYAAWLCPNAKIYSYEPEECNFRYLEQNVSINSLNDRVFLFNTAVGALHGTRELVLNDSPVHSFFADKSGSSQTVNCTTLSKILMKEGIHKIDLLKINCEGAEYEILEGCTAAEFECISNIRMEYHNLDDRAKNGRSIAKFLKNHGYQIHRFTRYPEHNAFIRESGFIWASRIRRTA